MATAHRADYVLDQGVWVARCRACGFRVADDGRRRAAGQFRQHIRQVETAVLDLATEEIDMADDRVQELEPQ